jgi:hypothetical protein
VPSRVLLGHAVINGLLLSQLRGSNLDLGTAPWGSVRFLQTRHSAAAQPRILDSASVMLRLD